MNKILLFLICLFLFPKVQLAQTASCLNFDGVDDYCGRSIFSTQTSSLTVEARFNWTGTTTANQIILYNGNTGSSGFGLFIPAASNNLVFLYGGLGTFSMGTLTPNTWNLFTTVLGNNTFSAYINGAFSFSASTGVNPVTPSGSFVIGANQLGVETFKGSFDEVRFWNRALCPSEVSFWSSCQPDANSPGLVAYYNFNQGIASSANPTVTSLLDVTTNSNNLTLNNFALSGSASNWINSLGVLNTNCGSTSPLTATISPATTPSICLGASATLSVSGINTYSWSNSATSASISVSPSITTSYSVVGINATSGCSGMAQQTVYVYPSSGVVTISASSASICSGSSPTLSASGASTYVWSNSSTSSSIVVTPTTTTLYTLTATSAASLGACTSTAGITLTVNATPTIGISSSPTISCSGNTAIITVTSTGSPTFSWSTGATTNTISVNPTVTTNYTVQASQNGCGVIRVHTLTVGATPTLTAPNRTVCTGKSATLTVTGTPGTLTYSWSTSQTGTASIIITPTTQVPSVEQYTVTGTTTANCSASRVITLTINQTPTVSSSQSTNSLCTGSTATLTGTGSGATSYTWTGGVPNGASFTPTIANTTASAVVNYTVTGTSALGCTNSAVASISVVLTPTFSPFANPVVFCEGASSTLSVNATIPLSLTWTPTGANTNSIVITPTAGTYTYVCTKQNGVCVDTKSVSVTVNALPSIGVSASPSVVCVINQTTSLFAAVASGVGYTWTPYGGNSQVAIVTASANTTFTLRGSNGVCTNSTTVLVTTNPNPTVNITATPSIICRGQSATLTATGASNGYSWTPINQSSSLVVVSPTTATNYTVVGTNSFGCTNTKVQTINVNPLPVFSATSSAAGGNTMVCLPGAGPSTATLTASNGANCTYSWSSGALTASTIVVPPTNPTIYTATATQTITGCQAFRTLTINIFEPTISVAGSFSACFGGAVTLTANTTPAPQVSPLTSYTWSGGNLTTPIAIQIANLSPTTQTTYSVIGRTQPPGSNLTCSTATFVTISIYLNPTVTAVSEPTLICKGAVAALSGSGAVTYQWSENQQVANSISVSPIAAANIYTVVGTDANGCSGTTTVQVKTSTCPGFEEFEKSALSAIEVFPNPNNGQFTVKGSEKATVLLINQLGQVIQKIDLTEENNYTSEIVNLDNGIYFVSNRKNNQKIIVTR